LISALAVQACSDEERAVKPIEKGEILGLADYEAIREQFRTRVIGEKKIRRVALGPRASALFENRDTILLQIQEMLRTERITRPAAVQHEIDTYNDNLPGDDELSCTVMIEIPETGERETFLHAAAGFEKHVVLVSDGVKVRARGVNRGGDETRTTAVHYLKFALPRELAATLRAAASGKQMPPLSLAVDHPAYTVEAPLPPLTVKSLAEDLV
jgi:hypothetical protein